MEVEWSTHSVDTIKPIYGREQELTVSLICSYLFYQSWNPIDFLTQICLTGPTIKSTVRLRAAAAQWVKAQGAGYSQDTQQGSVINGNT